ncbi:MAG TPA: glycosyltransferase family 39 protein [Chloroflexota bacterium]
MEHSTANGESGEESHREPPQAVEPNLAEADQSVIVAGNGMSDIGEQRVAGAHDPKESTITDGARKAGVEQPPDGDETAGRAIPGEEPSVAVVPATAEPTEPALPRVGVRAVRPGFRPATAVMLAMLLLSYFLRVLWLDQPPGSMIFDEKYYVSAARTILDLPQPADAPYAHSTPGKDANQEHPPLAKLIMAYDMRLLGDNGWGWRWGSVVAGTLAIAFMYQIGRHLGLGPWTGLLAAFLFSFDNLVFVTSRIGILDIFMVLGMVAGAAWFLRRQPILAGLAFAFGTLCKEYGLYGPAIVLLYAVALTLYQRPAWRIVRQRALRIVIMGVVYLASFLVALWLLDLRWSTYTNPITHLLSIWSYGTKLTHSAGPTGIESWPWEWLINEVQIPYLRVTVTICGVSLGNGVPCPQDNVIRQFDSILFRGALNPYLIAGLPLALAYALARLRGSDNRNALLALVWFALAYLPFLPATVLDRRIAYIYYMLPAVPAIALASAELFADPRIPRSVTIGYIVAILYGFAGYFPFAGFKL